MTTALSYTTSGDTILDAAALRAKLTGGRGFVWIKRELAPALADRIFNEGIPGIGILSESTRFRASIPADQLRHMFSEPQISTTRVSPGLRKPWTTMASRFFEISVLQEIRTWHR